MFERKARTQSQAEYARSQASKTASTPAQWQREAETWFDGSPESVDRRLAACERMLHVARAELAHDGLRHGSKHIDTIASLEVDKGALLSLRRDLLTAASDREAAEKSLSELFPPSDWDDFDRSENMYAPDGSTWDEYDERHPRKHSSLTPQDRRFVELESAKFVAANAGVPLDELSTRAQHFAELKTSTFTPQRSRTVAAAFVSRVAALHRSAPRPQVASAPATIPDFPAEFMYL